LGTKIGDLEWPWTA